MNLFVYLSILTAYTAAATALQIPFKPASRPDPSIEPNQQPDSSPPTDWPYRELPWGEVNVISTTDT